MDDPTIETRVDEILKGVAERTGQNVLCPCCGSNTWSPIGRGRLAKIRHDTDPAPSDELRQPGSVHTVASGASNAVSSGFTRSTRTTFDSSATSFRTIRLPPQNSRPALPSFQIDPRLSRFLTLS
jgi:hypothetical protein